MMDFRCMKCNKLLAKFNQCQVLEIKCNRCGMKNILRQTDKIADFAALDNYRNFNSQPDSNPIRTFMR